MLRVCSPNCAPMATAIAAASATLSPSLLFFSKPSRNLKFIRCSSSSSSSPTTEFNITFGSPPPKTQTLKPQSPPIPLLIPWIVRGEDGNLTLQSTPPPQLLHDLANAKTKKAKKKGPITSTATKSSITTLTSAKSRPILTSEPKFSKAARRFYNENFRDPPQRLSKVLAASGVASRRSCEELIFAGKVTVNGSMCNTPQTKVDPGRDMIYVNGNRISKKLPPKVYLALNKPKGYICSNGEKENKSVMTLIDDYLKGWNRINPGFPKPRLFTVGRLDVATTGLIVITNDGDFAQRISHPSSGLSKEYIAAIEGSVSKRQIVAISEGTTVDGVHCKPDSVELLPLQPDVTRPRLRIVVHEGRNHEVRELVKNAGLVLHSLKRVRIGGFRLPSDLGLGKHVELKQGDLKSLGGKS